MKDIKLLRELGAQVPCKDWLRTRTKETLAKHPKLNQDKNSFFDTPGITYVYDHDTIHQAVAIGSQPAYRYYIGDEEEVWCSREKWEAVSDEIKLNGVLEEALVLALERSQVPFDFKPEAQWSFTFALSKVCTSITSGWFRAWAWEHHDQVLEAFNNLPWDYVQRFKEAVESGLVKELPNEHHLE